MSLNNKWIKITYTACVCIMCVLSYNIYNKYKPNAWMVYIGNKPSAYVERVEDFKAINQRVTEEIKKKYGAAEIDEDLRFERVRISDNYLSSEDFIANSIKSNISFKVEGVLMKSDGREVGWLSSEQEIKEVLDKVKDHYAKQNGIKELKEYKLNNKITFVKGVVDFPEIESVEGITNKILNNGNPKSMVYFDVKGMADSSTASRSNTTISLSTPVVGIVTSNFGERWGKMHNGIDIGAPEGTMIYAARSGRVIDAHWEDGYGNVIRIDHGNGIVTTYGHCSSLLASKGEYVNVGHTVAKVGSTGRSTGPHLHFEVRIDGKPQNPQKYMK